VPSLPCRHTALCTCWLRNPAGLVTEFAWICCRIHPLACRIQFARTQELPSAPGWVAECTWTSCQMQYAESTPNSCRMPPWQHAQGSGIYRSRAILGIGFALRIFSRALRSCLQHDTFSFTAVLVIGLCHLIHSVPLLLWLLSQILSAITITNMLIGVICEAPTQRSYQKKYWQRHNFINITIFWKNFVRPCPGRSLLR